MNPKGFRERRLWQFPIFHIFLAGAVYLDLARLEGGQKGRASFGAPHDA